MSPISPAWQRKGTVYFVAADGLTLDVIEPMVERGELKHLASLAQDSSVGRLATITPTNSPTIWTCIATGYRPSEHGIDGFCYYRLLGRHVTRSRVRKIKRLGLKGIISALEAASLMKMRLFDDRHVRLKRFWEIISEAGGRVGLVNWWYTWPANRVNGFIVAGRLHYWRGEAMGHSLSVDNGLTYPPELLEDIEGLIISPDAIAAEDLRPFVNLPDDELQELINSPFEHHDPKSELRFMIAFDLTHWRIFERCLDSYPDLTVASLYLRCPDIASHCAFPYMPGSRRLSVSEDERRTFGQVVPQAYRFVDDVIGKIRARMGENDTLVLVSDHGFAYQEKRGSYGHARGQPPGVLYACGKEFAPGREICNANIYDVAPTLLRVCGIPLARDMAGRCLEEILAPEFRRQHPPPAPVESFGPRATYHPSDREPNATDKEIKDHLRALGYLD